MELGRKLFEVHIYKMNVCSRIELRQGVGKERTGDIRTAPINIMRSLYLHIIRFVDDKVPSAKSISRQMELIYNIVEILRLKYEVVTCPKGVVGHICI